MNARTALALLQEELAVGLRKIVGDMIEEKDLALLQLFAAPAGTGGVAAHRPSRVRRRNR